MLVVSYRVGSNYTIRVFYSASIPPPKRLFNRNSLQIVTDRLSGPPFPFELGGKRRVQPEICLKPSGCSSSDGFINVEIHKMF